MYKAFCRIKFCFYAAQNGGGAWLTPLQPSVRRPCRAEKGWKWLISLRVDSDTISPIANIYLYTRNMYIQIEFQKKSKLDPKVRIILRMPISRLYLTYNKFSKENESFFHFPFLQGILLRWKCMINISSTLLQSRFSTNPVIFIAYHFLFLV